MTLGLIEGIPIPRTVEEKSCRVLIKSAGVCIHVSTSEIHLVGKVVLGNQRHCFYSSLQGMAKEVYNLYEK